MRALCLLTGLLVGWGLGQPASGQNMAGVDPAEVAAALAELAEAGTPPTGTDIAGFLADAATPTGGAVVGRMGYDSGGQWDRTGRLNYARGEWDARLRWRLDHWGRRQAAGAVGLGRGQWRAVAGQLGLQQGFGLLVGGPGRGRYLTADGHLGPSGRGGFRPWVGEAEPQTMWGVGLQGGRGRWLARALVGGRGRRRTADSPTVVGQISRTGPVWQLALGLVRDPRENGLSFSGQCQAAGLTGAWEVSWRQPVSWRRGVGAVLTQAVWRPHRTVLFEALAGFAELGPRPLMGVKQAVLGDWAGTGVAARGTWKVAPGLGLKVLVHRSAGQQEIATGQRRRKLLSDIQLAGKRPGGARGDWWGDVRVRSGGEDAVAWSERFPWQPPALAVQDRKQVVSVRAGWRRDQDRVQVLWRRLVTSRVSRDLGWERAGGRCLLGISGARGLTASCLLRFSWTVAWGPEADLVSAVVPFGGFVLPRHWGHWRREELVGLELGRGGLRCRGAVSWRTADWLADPALYTDLLTVWLEGGWYW